MAAAAKLSPAQWAEVRAAWENDSRPGVAWLRDEMSLPVSRESMRKKMLSEGWAKRCTEPDSSANSTQTGMVATKVAQPNAANPLATLAEQNALECKPNKTRETPVLDELDETEPRQGIFVREYCKDLNGTQAAIRAGYAMQSAGQQAHELLKKPEIQTAVRELRDETLRQLEGKVEELVRYWLDILRADPNELSSFHRKACPYCWGLLKEDNYARHRQYSPAKYEEAKAAHAIKRSRVLNNDGFDIGDFDGVKGDWYECKAPNPQCPECFGKGEGELFIADTRNLPPGVAALFNGIKKTKDGIEVLLSSKEKASDQLGRLLGVFREGANRAVGGPTMTPEQLKKLYWERMQIARQRQQAVYLERGIAVDENGNPID